ncbi:MAG: tetratricopeptide repeat protein, partial [Actinomadura sp.]
QEAGEGDRALEVAARAAGQPVPRPATDAEEPDPVGAETETGAETEAGVETEEEIERRRAELFALVEDHDGSEGAGLVDPLRIYLRGQAGTPAAGEAGRRVIRTALEVMEYDPGQAREILELVVEYGEPAEVAVAYDEIGEVLGYLGGDMAAAVEAFRKGAAVDDPAALRPLRSLALALSELADWDGVAETAQRAVTSGDPHTVAVGYWLWGDSRRHRGDTDGAVRLYRQGIAVGHEDITSRLHYELARALRDRGECDAARAALEQAAEDTESGLDVVAGRLLGAWAYEDGDLDAAAEAFGRVAAVDVDTGEPDHGLAKLVETAAGQVLRVVRRAADEERHLVAVRALARLAWAGYTLAALKAAKERATECAESGDRAAAMLYVEGAVGFMSGSDPDADPDLEIELADLMVAAGAPAEARGRYERLIDHADAEVRLVATGRLVPLLRAAGDAEGLADVTGRVTDDSAETGLDPGARALLGSMLGVLQSERGDHEGALRTFRAAAASGEPTALFTLGEALVEAGRVEEAREVLARVDVAEAAIGRRALVALGQTYHDEDADRARELYRRALDAPGEPDGTAATLARMYLGSLAKRDRDWPAALRWYQQVIDSGGMTGNVSQASLAAAHLGELAYWLGDRDSAVRFYELTLSTGTRQAHLVGEAAYRLGEIRHGDGDLDLARKHLRQAVESGDEGFAERARALLDPLPDTSDTSGEET